jgi:hypothetical protein
MNRRILTLAALVLGLGALIGGAISTQTARGALGQPDAVSFAASREIALTHSTGSMVAGKFNGGAKSDLAILNYTPSSPHAGSVTIVREVSGRFREVRALRVPAFSWSIATGDVNGNGKLDLIVATPGNLTQAGSTMSVLLGVGNGTFGAAHTYRVGTRLDMPLLVADLNGNHRKDLVGVSGNKLVVLLGRGDGTFGARRNYVVDSSGGVTSLALADVNGDGKVDAVAGSWEAGSTLVGAISVMLGNGKGGFAPPVTTTTGDLLPTSLAIADLNRDGKRDLVVNDDVDLVDNGGAANHAAIVVYSGNGDGTFTQAHEYDLNELGGTTLSLRDVNGDGNRDAIVVLNSGFDVLLGDGGGGFEAPIAFSHAHWTGDARLAVADYNGDGKPDIAVSDLKRLSVFLNTTEAPAP